MNTLFRKLFLISTLAALVLAVLPLQTVSAAGSHDDANPPAATPDPEWANLRLKRIFFRQRNAVERIAWVLENSDETITRAEELLAKAKENGKDVSNIEAALADFKEALEAGQPIYEQAQAIVDEHNGFDDGGKVTDTEAARQTVRGLAEVLKQFRETTAASFKALREAIREYRRANPRPRSAPQP
jgi:hypothetical protein